MEDKLNKQFQDVYKNKIKEGLLNKIEDRVPIYKGCLAAQHGGCFCTGACKEIIAYRDKIPGEI